MKFLPLVWSNLKRKKTRTILTVLSITVAFVLFGLLAAIKQALIGGVDMAKADRLVVRNKVSLIISLPHSYQERIERIPGVTVATHLTWFGGIYKDPHNFFPQFPCVPEEFFRAYPEFTLPKEQLQAWMQSRTAAIAGRETARRFGWKIGDRIPIQSAIWSKKDGSQLWEFDLAGIFDAKEKGADTSQLLIRYDYFDEARTWNKGQVGWYVVRVRDPKQAVEVARRIDDEFANSPDETTAETEGSFVQGWAKQVGDVALITAAIMSAVFFTILLVAGNTMSQSVRERTGQLGVLKAIGFTNGQVLRMVLAESCLLSVLGGGVGLALASIIVARGDPTGGMLPMFYLPRAALLSGIGISAALGVATGIFPALEAMRLRVVDALRRM